MDKEKKESDRNRGRSLLFWFTLTYLLVLFLQQAAIISGNPTGCYLLGTKQQRDTVRD